MMIRKRVATYILMSEDIEKYRLQLSELNNTIKINDFILYKDYLDSESENFKSRNGIKQLMTDASHNHFDILIINDFTMIANSLQCLVKEIEEFRLLGIDLISLKESINTTTWTGKLYFSLNSIYSGISNSEASQKIKDGLNARKAIGFKLGKPVINKYIQGKIHAMREKNLPIRKIASKLNISTPTVMKYIKNKSEKNNAKLF